MQALILAGGVGTRFWPASRKARPKQLLPLIGGRHLLRRTVDRLLPILSPEDIWVCTHQDLAETVRGDLPEIPSQQVLAEPVGRNTAAAIGWSLASMEPARRRQVIASLHADHWIDDEDAFRRTLLASEEAVAGTDRIVALGVAPRWPEPGYGYLEMRAGGDATEGGPLRRVVRFVEKPDPQLAAEFQRSGCHLWNAGIFVFRGVTLLDHLGRLEPRLREGLALAAASPSRLQEVYRDLPALPIDTAVMERLEELYTVVLDCGWSDLGSWSALAELLEAGEGGNTTRGSTVACDARDNLLWAESGVVAVLGVEGLVVVQAGGAVLVLPKERSQEVRRIVDELRRRGREDFL